MLFMKYVSVDGAGFTPEKIYFGELALESGEMVSFDSVMVVDDLGQPRKIDPKQGDFAFLDEVFAVAVVDELPLVRVGDVVILTEVDVKDGKCMVEVKNMGYRSCNSVLVLDGTNIYPNLTVLDRATGDWETITGVNQSLWVKIGPEGTYRPLPDFKFAVSEGDILIRPYVTCVVADGSPLTEGRIYELLWERLGEDTSELVGIVDDTEDVDEYMAFRFKIF